MTQEARIQPRRPGQVDEQNEFSPRAATRLGVKPNSEMRAAIATECHAIDHERADHEQQLQSVEEVGRCLRVARGRGVQHEPDDDAPAGDRSR